MENGETKQCADGSCGDVPEEPMKETPGGGNPQGGEMPVLSDKPSEPEPTQPEEALLSEEQEVAGPGEPASMNQVEVKALTSPESEDSSNTKSLAVEKAVTLEPAETKAPSDMQSEQLPEVPSSPSPTEETTMEDTVSQAVEPREQMEHLELVKDESSSATGASVSCLASPMISEGAKSTLKELGSTSKSPSSSLQGSSGSLEGRSTLPGKETDSEPKPPSPVETASLPSTEPAAPAVSTSLPSTEPACSQSSGLESVEPASNLKEEVGARPPYKRVLASKTPFTLSRDAASHISPDAQNTTALPRGMSEEARKEQEASKLQEATEVFPKPSAVKASAFFLTPASGSDAKPHDRSHPIAKVESKLSDGAAVKPADLPSGQTSKPSNLSSAPPIGAAGCPPGGAKSSEPTAHPRRFGGARPRESSKPCSPSGAAKLPSAAPIKTPGNTAVQREAGNGATPSRPPPRPWDRPAAPFRTPNLRYSPRGRGGRVFATSERAPTNTQCVAHGSGGNPATCGIAATSGANSAPADNGSKEAVPRRSPQKKGARRKATREEQDEGRGDEKAGAAAPAPSTSKEETAKFRRGFRNAELGDGAKERGYPPIPLPRNLPVNSEARKAAAEQWVQCPLPHVDPKDTDTMYLMSLKERISRFSAKKKSMLMMKMQEVLHEIEFETEVA